MLANHERLYCCAVLAASMVLCGLECRAEANTVVKDLNGTGPVRQSSAGVEASGRGANRAKADRPLPAMGPEDRHNYTEARQALRVLCPRRLDLAPHFDRAAEKYKVDVALLVAVVRAESTCRSRAVGPKGSVGLMQILPGGSAAKGTPTGKLLLVSVSLRLGSRHLAHWLSRCGDYAGAIGVYGGHRDCEVGRASGYARRVLGLWQKAKIAP